MTRFSNRLAVAIVLALATACACAVVSVTAIRALDTTQLSRTEAQLRAEVVAHRDHVKEYFDIIADDLLIAASTRIVREGVVQFDNAFNALGDDATATLQRLYITENPNPPDRKHALLRALDDSQFSDVHERYHGWLTAIALAHNHYDVFLISARGNVVYTSYKEADFATNLLTGPYRASELGKTFRRVRDTSEHGSVTFSDFARYAPSGDRPAAFIGTPVTLDEIFVGALLVQLKPEHLSELISHTLALGSSSEAYLVGADGLMRSQSRFETENTVLVTRVDTPSVKAALTHTAGVHETFNYLDEQVLSTYTPLQWGEITWAVVAEMAMSEIQAPAEALRDKLIGIGAILTLAAFVLGFVVGDKETQA